MKKRRPKAPVTKVLATLEEAGRFHPYQLDQLVGYTITEIQEEDEFPVLVCSRKGRPDLFAIVLGDSEANHPGVVEISVDRQHSGRTFADVAVGEVVRLEVLVADGADLNELQVGSGVEVARRALALEVEEPHDRLDVSRIREPNNRLTVGRPRDRPVRQPPQVVEGQRRADPLQQLHPAQGPERLPPNGQIAL